MTDTKEAAPNLAIDPASPVTGNAFASSSFIVTALTIVGAILPALLHLIPQDTVAYAILAAAATAVAYIVDRGLLKRTTANGAAAIAVAQAQGANAMPSASVTVNQNPQ